MFPQTWTVFYWAWYIAYAPYMGIFMARVSRGRTFRDVVITAQTFGTLGCAMFFALFGNNAMYQYLTGRFDFLAVKASQGEDAAIVGALMHLTEFGPLALLILVIFVFVGFVYSATTVNASAYAIATVASKNMDEGTDVEPNLFNRVIWAVFLGAIALALMYQDQVVTQSAVATSDAVEAVVESTGPAATSVLTAVKVSSLGVAIPLMVCVLIAILSFLKWIKEDEPHLEKGTLPAGRADAVLSEGSRKRKQWRCLRVRIAARPWRLKATPHRPKKRLTPSNISPEPMVSRPKARLEPERRVQVEIPLPIAAQPVAAHAELGKFGELVGEFDRSAEGLAGFHQTVCEPHAQRFFSGYRSAGQDEIEGVAVADQTREPNGSTIHERHPPTTAEDPEHGIARGDSQITPDGEFEPPRHGVPFDGCDDGFGEQHPRRAHRAIPILAHPVSSVDVIALRSAPAQNAPFEPVKMATERSSLSSKRRNAAASSRAVGPSTQLRTSGRSIVTIATGPSVSKEMFMDWYLQHLAGGFVSCSARGCRRRK